jgi:pilus assembly protein CpaB
MSTMRRLLAVLTALALAVFGAVVLVAYVHGADARAQAGAVLVPVLVVDTDIAAGTAAEDVAGSVSTVEVPKRLVATGAIDDLADVAGLTTTVGLLAGDQVMAARFGDPTVQSVDGAPLLPAGLEEVSISLESQRAVGGALAPGDRVGVYISAAGTDPTAAQTMTDLAVGQVLVTRVSGGSSATSALTPAGTETGMTVTLALGEDDAATVIGGMELGTVWLSLQSGAVSADNGGDSTLTTTGANQ